MTKDNAFSDAQTESNKKETIVSSYSPTVTKEEERIFQELTKSTNRSGLVLGIYGLDGTGKSGIVMDARTEEEKEAGKKIIIFDLDTSNSILKSAYHSNDPNIIVINPYQYENNKLSYSKTHENIILLLDVLYKKFKPEDIKLICIDTCAKLLEICKNAMKEELELNYHEMVPTNAWEVRRIKHDAVIDTFMRFDCMKVFVTHYKREMLYKNGIQYDTIYDPKWFEEIPKLVTHRIEMSRDENYDEETGVKTILFKGIIKKSRNDITLEEKVYNVGLVKTINNKYVELPKWKSIIPRLETDIANKDERMKAIE